MSAVVTGLGFAVPGVRTPADLLGPVDATADPIDFRARLGRKGLRYQDQATRLTRCAARDALVDAGLLDDAGLLLVPGDRVGVSVSSNFGNLDTVCRTVETIATGGARVVSPMDLPNASSNVVASTIAISHGLRGPNLMLCNGVTSGLDAVGWAVRLLTAGRADQVVVVGVEPDTEPARRLLGHEPAFDGAVALVLERESAARDRGATVRARLSGYAR
ncbi:MAG TPA: beta-ketoacyl synthase N-terminal-like domain-containing protein, partial [Micromonospora sp.]